MSYTETGKLLNFSAYLDNGKIFIETGSCYGRSIQLALDAGFKKVRSVEAKPEYYNHCVNQFKDNENVKLYLGKSVDRLQEMLEGVEEPCVFWLDAHVSGEASAGYADWKEKGLESDYHQHTAIKKELTIVLAHRTDHVITIDDQNGFNADNAEYMGIMLAANPAYKFYFVDEQMGETFYKNKILVAIP